MAPNKPPDRRQHGSLPLAARDRLYALFVSVLGREDAPELFAGAVRKGRARGTAGTSSSFRGAQAYVAERTPRYLRALAALRGAPGPLEVWAELFRNGLYFDAHEYLERFWREASGPDKQALQGLIQAAAAFHKLEQDPGARAGARWLLERALEKLPT